MEGEREKEGEAVELPVVDTVEHVEGEVVWEPLEQPLELRDCVTLPVREREVVKETVEQPEVLTV